MPPLTFTAPVVNQPNSTEDPKIVTALTQLLAWGNGNVPSISSSGTHALNFGNSSVAFTSGTNLAGAGNYAPAVNVTHGLGATPAAVLLTPFAGGPVGVAYSLFAGAFTSSTFTVQAFQDANLTATIFFYWLALV